MACTLNFKRQGYSPTCPIPALQQLFVPTGWFQLDTLSISVSSMAVTHESHSSEHGQARADLESEVKQGSQHDDQVKNVPPIHEKLLTQGHNLHDAFERENSREYLMKKQKIKTLIHSYKAISAIFIDTHYFIKQVKKKRFFTILLSRC